jgi:beta-lactamase superfamily II metal-dependent hydrolase
MLRQMLEEQHGSQKKEGLLQRGTQKISETVKRIAESWGFETLTDDGETSPINNTSAILLFEYTENGSTHRNLFTGDAGVPALDHAIDRLGATGIDPSEIDRVQVPHHGSRRNVSPTLLNRLLGNIRQEGETVRRGFVSAAKEGEPKHPSKKVLNAFRRRGIDVYSTQGSNLWCYQNAPDRENYSPSSPFPLYSEVEE